MNELLHSSSSSFIPPEVGELAALFPAYEISHLISTGGMGAVYYATQKSLDRTVAIKILPRELSADEAFREGFVAEAKAMARLNHPNLISVYDSGEVDGMLYIIMEFVPGQSIYHSAHGLAIDPIETIRLVSSICHGLAHAHENGIVHRDIKPANILLDLNAHPKVGDFGLARPFDQMVNEGDEIYGTPHYTAPEVVNPPYVACYRADIYSVGVMLHELLTGQLPTPDQRPASSIVHCDPRFDAIIRRATKPEPEHRYTNAHEMANDLIAIANRVTLTHAAIPAPDGLLAPSLSVPALQLTTAPHRPPQSSRVQGNHTEAESSGVATFLKILLAVGLGIFAYKQYQKSQQPHIVIVQDPAAETRTETRTETPPAPQQEIQPAHLEVASFPIPETAPARSASLLPEPEPVVPTAPESSEDTLPGPPSKSQTDLDAFYERARKIMKTRAAPILAEHEKRNESVLADYQKEVKREIRKVDSKYSRDRLDDTLEVFIDGCKKDHNTLPENPDTKIAAQINIVLCHMEAVQKQKSHDEALGESLGQMSATYILGLEKQMDRLKAANDTAAAALIQQEIDATRSSKDYFANLILE